MDATYLATHIGGGNHRLFDGGHDLLGAWGSVRDALPDDSLGQEVIGYASALLKDVTTPGGLPIMTITPERYGEIADQITAHVPGAGREWAYDLLTYDAFEVLTATLGVASTLFFLKNDDNERLAESLGSMGIVSIISANPLLGVAIVLITAYAYVVKKKKVEGKRLAMGASLSGLSLGLFAILGLPILLELGIVLVVAALLRKQIMDRDDLLDYLKSRVAELPRRLKSARTARIPSVDWRNVSVPNFKSD
jgi:hypothetical protein